MPFTPLDIVKYAFAAFVTVNFIQYARSGKARRHMTVFSRRTPKEWATAITLVVLEVALILALIMLFLSLSPQVMGFSWLNLLATTKEEANSGTNLMVAPAEIPWFGIIFGGLLALNMPRLARREEEIFRRGTVDWKDGALRSLKFGLIHMVVGVPLAAGLALSVAGLFFTWRYFKGGVREASFYHSLHNLGILVLLAVYFLTGGK